MKDFLRPIFHLKNKGLFFVHVFETLKFTLLLGPALP